MDPFMLKTTLERNHSDLEQYSRELTEWSKEMKKKECGRKDRTQKKDKKKVNINTVQEKEAETSQKIQRVGAVDYGAWEKYDADKECDKLDDEKTISAADYDDVSDETDEENIDESIIEKDKGNNFFKSSDFKNAIKCYNKAIELYAYNPIYFANRAMCYLKLESYEKAESDCSLALALDKTYVKAYQRRSVARENLNKLIEAKQDVLRVFDFEASNKESKEILKRIENKMKEIAKPPKAEIVNPKIEPMNATVTQRKEDKNDIARPKSKFALSRQQNKDIKTTYSPSNLIEPISDKIIERKIESESSVNINEIKTNSNQQKTDIQEQLFKWPQHDVEIKKYSAIEKAPKARSQSTLKKIAVLDIEPKSIKNLPSIKDENAHVVPKNVNKPVETVTKNEGCTEIPTNIHDLDKLIFHDVPNDNFSKLINRSVPRTALQFYCNWKELDSELKYLFFLQIHPKEFVNIFKDSLESCYFSAMLKVMAEEFIPRKKTVVPHLYGLSNVKRFSTLTMFKTAEDTSVLKILLAYIQEDEELSKFIDLLKKRYEMF